MASALAFCITGTVITAYGQDRKTDARVTKEKEDVREARKDRAQAQKVSKAEYRRFKKDAQAKIAANSEKIDKLKAEYPENSNSAVRADYYRRVAALEQKNNDLKRRVKEAKPDGNWSRFKSEFNHDLDDLGKPFKGLVTEG